MQHAFDPIGRPILIAALICALSGAIAAAEPGRLDLWSIELGKPVEQIRFNQVAVLACGTNGGGPSRELAEAADFRRCRPEASGLREVYFEYDDEQAYIHRAQRSEYEGVLGRTSIFAYPIVASVLVDDAGRVVGLRAVTDDRADVERRTFAYRLMENLKNRFARWNLACEEIGAEQGQSPVAGIFEHQKCSGEDAGLGQRVFLESRYFRRLGQHGIDPHSGNVTEGAFESSTRLEVVLRDAAPATGS